VDAWAEDDDDEYEEHFAEVMEDMDSISGITAEFQETRAVYRANMKRKLRGKGSPKSVSSEVFKALNETYEAMGKNQLGGKKIFKEEPYEYLHGRFGKSLGAYLQWHNLLFAAYDSMKPTNAEWLNYVNFGQPGQNFSAEVTRARQVEVQSELSKFAEYAHSGYMPYLRCGCDGVALMDVDGQTVAPADFETAYRWNELGAKKLRKKNLLLNLIMNLLSINFLTKVPKSWLLSSMR